MHPALQFFAIALMVLSSAGCDSFKGLTTELDGKADATQLFWARLQGIQWHGNEEVFGLLDANVATVRKYDINGVSRGLATLSEKHLQIANQLMLLDANNVDETAINYRDRLVAAHQSLYDENKTLASATENRDMQGLSQAQPRLKSVMTEYAQLCNEKDSIMSTLKDRYDREFDVAE